MKTSGTTRWSGRPLLRSIGLLAVLVGLFWCLSYHNQLPWIEAEAHLAQHQHRLEEDTRELIRSSERGVGKLVNAQQAPKSLAVPHLKAVEVHSTHVNLILRSNPDATSGFRVWITPRPNEFEDRPTSIPFVGRYHFSEDDPTSPSNRP